MEVSAWEINPGEENDANSPDSQWEEFVSMTEWSSGMPHKKKSQGMTGSQTPGAAERKHSIYVNVDVVSNHTKGRSDRFFSLFCCQ
jgi:hypothetical protein